MKQRVVLCLLNSIHTTQKTTEKRSKQSFISTTLENIGKISKVMLNNNINIQVIADVNISHTKHNPHVWFEHVLHVSTKFEYLCKIFENHSGFFKRMKRRPTHGVFWRSCLETTVMIQRPNSVIVPSPKT